MDNHRKCCRVCGKLFEVGSRSLCRPCQRAQKHLRSRGAQRKRLRCDCGKPAVTVLDVRVGVEGVYRARLPLCAECYAIEKSYGLQGVELNPAAPTRW
jgi:hypothetical protein